MILWNIFVTQLVSEECIQKQIVLRKRNMIPFS